jgi:hypothetical protein
MFGFLKRKPQLEVITPQSGHYNWASMEDRFAERAMVVFMEQKRLTPGGLQMDFEEVAKGAYRMAQVMVNARVARYDIHSVLNAIK